jgi:hypothetical protein
MHTIKKIISTCKNPDGYNLIQLAIAMLVIGLMVAPFVNLYTVRMKFNQVQTSYSNVETALNAIQTYKKVYGVYPCPAPLNIPRTDPAYGHMVDETVDPLSCRDTAIKAIAPGTCGAAGARSVCVEEAIGGRKTFLAAKSPPVGARVIVGAIPFRLLQVDEEKTVDGYGSKLVYAVTESMTDSNAFNEKNGAISVRDEQNKTLVDPDGSAAFMIISHGPDKVGGYSLYSGLQQPCVGAGKDLENCNIGFQTTAASSPDSIYISAYESDGVGTNHYDDIAAYFSDLTEPLWRRIANTDNIQDMSERNVGVGIVASDANVQLDISSGGAAGPVSLRVYGTSGAGDNGKLRADNICDPLGSDCFNPAIIADNNTTGLGMKCPPDAAGKPQYMQGIANGKPICKPMADLVVNCSPGQVLMGIDSDGEKICSDPPNPPCSSKKVTVCATDDFTLPLKQDTGTSTASGGSCRTQPYVCNSGTWSTSGGASGLCIFKSGVTTVTGAGIACGAGYTGTYSTTNTTTTCGTAGANGNTRATDCTCVGLPPATTTKKCSAILGSQYGGNATQTTTVTPSPTNSHVCVTNTTAWDTSKCTCTVPSPATKTVSAGSCGSGQTGTITKVQTFNASKCAWEDGATTNTCTCNTTPIYTYQDHDCSLSPYNTACFVPNTADKDRYKQLINASTCKAGAASLDTQGSCTPKSFTWVQVGTNGDVASSKGSRKIGASCTCTESANTTPVQCFQATGSNNQIFFCRCQ